MSISRLLAEAILRKEALYRSLPNWPTEIGKEIQAEALRRQLQESGSLLTQPSESFLRALERVRKRPSLTEAAVRKAKGTLEGLLSAFKPRPIL